MSLIPFILDLADELHEFSRCLANGVDINDFGFGLYAGPDPQHQQSQQQQQQQQHQQQQQQSPRRNRTSSFSSLWLPSKRHHPYNRIKTACCAKTNISAEDSVANPSNPDVVASVSTGGTPGKSAAYSVVNKNGFQVSMNVKQFAPNELSVKTIDNCIVVEGRHDDKEDGHGVISRHFVRKYMLPKGYDPNDVLSTLSSDGILTVKAPPPPPPATKNDERNERIIEIHSTPGPTPVVVVVSASAKETPPTKEQQTKKVTAPPSRLECQLPEKRQKLDVANEQVMKETSPSPAASEAAAAAPPPPPPPPPAAPPAPPAEATSDDVVMENVDEATTENEQKDEAAQQNSDVVKGENDIETEKTTDIIEKVEKLEKSQKLPKESEEIVENENEKETLDEKLEKKTNGETKNSDENLEEFESVEEESIIVAAVTEKENTAEILSEINASNEKSDTSKMDVDENEIETVKEADNNDVVDTITKTDTKANASADSAATATAAATAADADADAAAATTTTTTTNGNDVTIATNNKTTNGDDTSTGNNTGATEITTDKESAVKTTNSTEENNGIKTGKLPVDIPNSNDAVKTTAEATDTITADVTAESVLGGDEDIETAVLKTTTITNTTTNTTKKEIKNSIDDVALLKAAVTADPAEISAAEKNVVLAEPMDGIDDGEDSSKVETNVECSLFNKSLLGNGNTTTALVATEEMAN